jgi:hypothetical protein
MFGEFCLMRGVEESCLVSLAPTGAGKCLLMLRTPGGQVFVPCTLVQLENAFAAKVTLYSGDGECLVSCVDDSFHMDLVGSPRRTISYRVEATRVRAAVTLLNSEMMASQV